MIVKATQVAVDDYVNDFDLVGFVVSIRKTFAGYDEDMIRIETNSSVNNVAYKYPEDTVRLTNPPIKSAA